MSHKRIDWDNIKNVSDLKEISTIHLLAVHDAPLNVLKAAFHQMPGSLTVDVFRDAFQYGAKPEMLLFLAEMVDYRYDPELLDELPSMLLRSMLKENVDTLWVQNVVHSFPMGTFWNLTSDAEKISACVFGQTVLLISGRSHDKWLAEHNNNSNNNNQLYSAKGNG